MDPGERFLEALLDKDCLFPGRNHIAKRPQLIGEIFIACITEFQTLTLESTLTLSTVPNYKEILRAKSEKALHPAGFKPRL